MASFWQRCCEQGGIDGLPAHGQIAIAGRSFVEAAEQPLDGTSLLELFAMEPDRPGVRHRLVQAQATGRPLILLISEGQMSDHKGAALMLPSLPQAQELLGHKGYDSNRFRQALIKRGIAPCIPSSRSRTLPIPYGKVLYRLRHRIENMFGCLKDRRRIAMRYGRCAHALMSAIRLAATVLFWIDES